MSASKRAITRSLIISGIVAIPLFLIIGIDLDACAATLRRLDFGGGALLFAFYGTAAVLRGARLKALLPSGVALSRLVTVSFRHQFFAIFLPFRTGEAALPILLKGDGVPVPRSVAVLVFTRALDLLALLTVLSGAYLVTRSALPKELGGLGSVLVVIWILAAGLGLWVLLGGKGVVSALRRTVTRLARPFGKLGAAAGKAVDAVLAATVEIPLIHVLRGFLCSLGIWSCLAAFYASLFDQIVGGQPIAVWVVLSMFLSLGSQIPIQGFAGIGTTEALIVVLLASVGVAEEEALASGVVIHGVQIVFCALIGLLGFAGAARGGGGAGVPSVESERVGSESPDSDGPGAGQ